MSTSKIVNAKLECMKLAFEKSNTFQEAIQNYKELVTFLCLPGVSYASEKKSITDQAKGI